MAQNIKNLSQIRGWGADLAAKNRPAARKEGYAGSERANLNIVPQETRDIEVYHSIERPGLTPVFGTSTPPMGLSGMIRKMAFRYSESHLLHWFSLLLADRINVVEGILMDLRRGKIPNFFAESGWSAEWKYNRPRALKKIALGSALVIGLTFYVLKKNKADLA